MRFLKFNKLTTTSSASTSKSARNPVTPLKVASVKPNFAKKVLFIALLLGVANIILASDGVNPIKLTEAVVADHLNSVNSIFNSSSHDDNTNSVVDDSSVDDSSVDDSSVDDSSVDNLNVDAQVNEVSWQGVNIDKVYVDKSEQKLYLMQGDRAVKSYHIALGDAPKGHKQREGDERTPEGIYTLDYKNENSIAYRSIHVSYPNAADVAYAKAKGVSAGGAIMIHGQMNGYGEFATLTQQRNWTDGCIAVTDSEMDEIMDAVKIGTPIEIVW